MTAHLIIREMLRMPSHFRIMATRLEVVRDMERVYEVYGGLSTFDE
jgi:hypothetical protein